MGDGQFLDIILFAMIAAFLVLRLRSVLGRRTGVCLIMPVTYARDIAPLIRAHCVECHNADKHKGDVRLDDLSLNGPGTADRWSAGC